MYYQMCNPMSAIINGIVSDIRSYKLQLKIIRNIYLYRFRHTQHSANYFIILARWATNDKNTKRKKTRKTNDKTDHKIS